MKVLHLISGGDTGGAKTHVHSLLAGLTPRMPVKMVCFTEGPFAQEARALGMIPKWLPGRNLFRNLNTIDPHGYRLEALTSSTATRPRQHDGGLPGQADRTAYGVHRPQ